METHGNCQNHMIYLTKYSSYSTKISKESKEFNTEKLWQSLSTYIAKSAGGRDDGGQ